MDSTEDIRKDLVKEINKDPNGRESLEKTYGQVWDTDQLSQDFKVTGFMAPFVVVQRKADGSVGMLMFQHHPRFYFSFTKE
jgi:hypothetical protein